MVFYRHMKNLHEKAPQLLFVVSFAFVVIAFVAALFLFGLEAYVRWSINQNFTFLGGYQSESLLVGAVALLATLLYVYGPRRS